MKDHWNLCSFQIIQGKMYHIANQLIDLNVTWNHQMWVSKRKRINGKEVCNSS